MWCFLFYIPQQIQELLLIHLYSIHMKGMGRGGMFLEELVHWGIEWRLCFLVWEASRALLGCVYTIFGHP